MREISDVKLPKEEGIEPLRLLNPRLRSFREDIEPREVGMEPVRLL